MQNILDLNRYPLDQPGTPGWITLVDLCKADLARDGMFNLEGLMRPGAVRQSVGEVTPVLDSSAFTHKRSHNIYFKKEIPGISAGALCWKTVQMSILWIPFMTPHPWFGQPTKAIWKSSI